MASFTRIFFATDAHGSDTTFMKFVNAAKVYKADVVILGGDITGKAVIPIIKQPDGSYKTFFMEKDQLLRTTEEVSKLEETIILNGLYPFHTIEAEMKELNADPSKVQDLFTKLAIERLERWSKIAAERLKPMGVKMYATGGNDDMWEIEPVLKDSEYIIDPEGQVVRVDDDHEMISSSHSNMTPWKCPRDISEEELEKIIEGMTSKVENMRNCIFNIHIPPVASELDSCVKLDTSTYPPRPILGETIAAGSTAVRKLVEKFQPLLGLHGHIHESRGTAKIGRTLCVNPGSEYSEGILRGIIVNVGKDNIKSHQFVSG